jgi:hypothetical protein
MNLRVIYKPKESPNLEVILPPLPKVNLRGLILRITVLLTAWSFIAGLSFGLAFFLTSKVVN